MKTLAFLLLFLLLIGCSEDQSLNPTQEVDFGARYGLETNSEDAPSIKDGSLIVKVNYSGCGGNHSFELKSRTTKSKSEIWLFKETKDQICDAYFVEERSFKLSKSIINSKEIVLLTPNDGEISLRK